MAVGTIGSLERIAHSRIMVLIFLCQTATGEIVIDDPLGDVIVTQTITFGLL